jgi:MOSC domain-containing protein YiiM
MVTKGSAMTDPAPRVEAIFVYPRPRAEGVPVPEADAVAGKGLAGDHDRSPWRQVTVLAREAWRAANEEVATELPPQTRRANVVVSGLDLANSRGRRLRLGQILLEVGGETKPCERMDEASEGLRAALTPDWRAGVFGRIVEEGRVAVGDRAGWE